MLTMYDNHNAVAAERKASYTGGPVPMEFYLSQGNKLIHHSVEPIELRNIYTTTYSNV